MKRRNTSTSTSKLEFRKHVARDREADASHDQHNGEADVSNDDIKQRLQDGEEVGPQLPKLRHQDWEMGEERRSRR